MPRNAGLIDANREPVFTLPVASRYDRLRINGKTPAPSTLFRHAKNGVVRPSDGQRVYLETTLRGRVMVTSYEAIDRFIDQVNGRDDVPAALSNASNAAAAERELAASGIR
jgi:hypothetical protein